MISEMLYTDCYQNCMQLMDYKKDSQPKDYADAAELLPADHKMTPLDVFYSKQNMEKFANAGPGAQGWVEKILH